MASIREIAQRYTWEERQVNTGSASPELYFPPDPRRWAVLFTKTAGQSFGYAFSAGQAKLIQGSLDLQDHILLTVGMVGPLIQQAIIITGNGQPNAGWVFSIIDNEA